MILKPKTNSFDLLEYNVNDRNFHLLLANISNVKFPQNEKMPENIKFSLSYLFFFSNDTNSPLHSTLFVSEEFIANNRTYERNVNDFLVSIETNKTIISFIRNSVLFQGFKDFNKINNTLELIGVFAPNESVVILFFRFHSTIQYCTVDEVNTHLILNENRFQYNSFILVFEKRI